jgi:hypothetical protein
MTYVEHCDASFKQTVLLKCYEAMEASGFTRYRKQDVDWPMEHGFHCWVGLNTGLERDHLNVNPFVCIHVVPIMKFYPSLEGRKYSRSTATYAIHMGSLSPKESMFRFTRKSDIAEEANRLARLYVDVGLPYALSIGSYERLLPLLRERVPMLGAYPERVASCLYLMGRKDEARSFTEDFLVDHRDYFERFATPFLKLLRE